MSNLKPWTPSDMIQNASNWSLAGDAHLLAYLESFSEDLLSKAESTHENLNKLINNLNNTSLSLDLVKKEFFSLHNTQFIESRVYEDDYSDSAVPDQSVDDKNMEEQKGIDWKEAIRDGMEVVNDYFDKVEVPGSDTEDETDFPSYVLRPKDLYADRRLPHVIGSEEWHKKWHVGLLDTSSESEDENILEKFSESDSDDLNINNRIKFVDDNELFDASHNVTAKQPVANSTFEDMINNSDLFGSSDSVENNNSLPIQAPVSTNSFAHELARKLGHVIEQNPTIVEPEVNRKPIQTSTSSRVIGNLFDDEPPPLDEDDIFGDNVPKGLFSGGAGLFDDIPSDASWIKDKNLPSREDQGKSKAPKQKLPDLFGDDIDDLFNETGKKIEPELSQSKKAPISDLFDDHILDDDDDLFKDTISKPHTKTYLPSTSSSGIPYFASEPPELKLPTTIANDSKKTDKKPIGGVKIFGDTDILGNNMIAGLKPTTQHSKKSVNINDVNSNKDIPILKNPSNLFDDLHSGSINSQRISETNKKDKIEETSEPPKSNDNKKPQTRPSYLFEDEDDLFGDDLFSNISVKKFTSDLFSDEVTNDNLFAADSNKSFHENLGFTSPVKTKLDNNFPDLETEKVQETENKKSESSSNKSLEDTSRSEVTSNIPENDATVDEPNNASNTTQVKNLSININLFDQNPPDLDDGWDSKSDNLFDDNENLFDSTSVVTSHRSGLFDDEPPSLFSESSGIIRDMSTRVETDDSFNPFASSSRRFSTDIFNEQQSSDSFFVTKNKSNIEHRTQSHLDSIPEISVSGGDYSTLDITPSGNANNLFSDSTFDYNSQHSNITDDDLFSHNVSNIKAAVENVDILKTKSDDLFSSSKINMSDYLEYKGDIGEAPIESEKKSPIFVDRDIEPDIFSTKEEKKQDESSSEPTDVIASTDDFASKIGSPGKLKHNLNINVGALMPGRGIVTKKDMTRTKSVEGDLISNKITAAKGPERSLDAKSLDKDPELLETSTLSGNEAQILSNITKDRAKILVKRRPSTRKARQESVRNSIADFRINVSVDDPLVIEVNPISLKKETNEKSTGSTVKDNLPKESENISKSSEKSNVESSRPKSFASSNLFDDPEDFDDLFSSLKLPPKSTILKQSLFDEENDDDDDIFGNPMGLSMKANSNASTSKGETKKPPKAAQITKLENRSVVEDPLSLFED